jgi:hypothetical protein
MAKYNIKPSAHERFLISNENCYLLIKDIKGNKKLHDSDPLFEFFANVTDGKKRKVEKSFYLENILPKKGIAKKIDLYKRMSNMLGHSNFELTLLLLTNKANQINIDIEILNQ